MCSAFLNFYVFNSPKCFKLPTNGLNPFINLFCYRYTLFYSDFIEMKRSITLKTSLQQGYSKYAKNDYSTTM